MLKKLFLISFISFFCLGNSTKFTIIIPSYNNEKWCLWNISSVLNQKYDDFEVVYINDCSKDKTLEIVQNYINSHANKNKVKIINRTKNCGALKNIYDAVHKCSDDTVIVTVDGDDALANKHVLKYLDSVYQDKNIWLTYGQYIEYPSKKIGMNKVFPDIIRKNNAFRKYTWCATHLRTFYAGLFKKIKLEDLQYNGQFFDVAGDAAFTFPLLEMCSRGHFKFVDKILYLYNVNNSLNDFRIKAQKQAYFGNIIRSRLPYAPL